MALRLSLLASVALLFSASCSDELSEGPSVPPIPFPPIVLGEKMTAENEQWTWVDFPESKCANGISTGIGLNLTTRSNRAFIYLMHGGACWDEATCLVLKLATNFETGYVRSDFDKDKKGFLKRTIFDREDATNPFRDFNFVFVPYCTGDAHTGDQVAQYGSYTAHHKGRANIEAFMKRIVPTFPGASQVVFAGSSAGGMGATYHWWRVQQYFGNAPVDLLVDSGTILTREYFSKEREEAWREAWNLDPGLPPDCTTCSPLAGLLDYYGAHFPNKKAAFVSFQKDTVLSVFFGIGQSNFKDGLSLLTKEKFDRYPNFKYFQVDESDHILFKSMPSSNGVKLNDWMRHMTENTSSGWQNVLPPEASFGTP